MRAHEFITEAFSRTNKHSDDSFTSAHPGSVGPSGREELYVSRYYDFYRISNLTGLSPEDLAKTDVLSYLGNLPMYSAYTDAEYDKLKGVLKKLGLKPKDYVPRGSNEQEDTQKASPMKAFKGYKK